MFTSPASDELNRRHVVNNGLRVWQADHCGYPTGDRRASGRCQCFLVFLARLPRMHPNIDKAGSKARAQAVDIFDVLRDAVLEEARLGFDDRLALCQYSTSGIQPACRID